MERFGLTRYDLMLMKWYELILLFEASADDESNSDRKTSTNDGVHYATEEELFAWA